MGGSVNSWVIFEITQSQLWVGLVAGARAIPFLFFALLGGVISDRFGRKNLMIGSLSLFAIAAAITAILIANELLVAWHMIAVSLIGAIGGALYGPAFFALVADIVHSDRLSNANGIISVARTTGEMLGPMIVGFIIAVSGADTVFWLIVVGNFFGLLLLTRIREPSRIENLNEPVKLTFFAQMAEGLEYARNTPPLLWLTLLVIAQNLFGSAIFAVMPTYAVDILKIGPTGFGLMGGVLGGRNANWCGFCIYIRNPSSTRLRNASDGRCLGHRNDCIRFFTLHTLESGCLIFHGFNNYAVVNRGADHVPASFN